MYLSKDRKDQESSRNYVTWGMAEGSEDVYFGRRIKGIQNHFKHEEQLFFGGRNILLSSFRGHGVGTRLESIWRRAGINKVKHILRIMTALHGIWYPLCECCPCQWMAWSRVAGKMYPKPGRLYPQCSWVSRSIECKEMKVKTRIKEQLFSPKWLCICLCSVQNFSSLRLLRECHEQEWKRYSVT